MGVWSLECGFVSSGESPGGSEFLVFGLGQEDVNGVSGGVDGGDEFLELALGHGGASGGCFAAAAAPDVEENGTSKPGDRVSAEHGIVVTDVEFEGVGVVALAHLGFFFPCGGGFVLEDDVAVVNVGFFILDPEIACGDAAVFECRVFADAGGVSVSTANFENAGRGASVSVVFVGGGGVGGGVEAGSPRATTAAGSCLLGGGGAAGGGVESVSPRETTASDTTSPRGAYFFPSASVFLIDGEGDV